MNQIPRRRVLFLCTHNSSRSIMAEAIVNHFLSEVWVAYSAGTDPRGVNPLAILALHEIGIEVAHAESKHLDKFSSQPFDCVMTLCNEANESCPFWPGAVRREHINFPDPSLAIGHNDKKMIVFREIRDKIKEIILPMLLE